MLDLEVGNFVFYKMLNCIKIWNNIPYLSGTWKYPDLIKEKKN